MHGENERPAQPIEFGKYTLLERISHGGMAEVFRAKTSGAAGFERIVAIKVLLPTVASDDEFITMLIDEAKIAGQLSHANIAQIFDLGQLDGRYYIVQEYVAGRDLRSILGQLSERGHGLTVAQACHVMLKVCEGLDYAHAKRDVSGRALNLVHRDISPQNVIVSYEGEVKLIDFGIAKAEGRATRTLAGLVKGKFAYMSPEQLRGLPVDRRSDVFACGIVLHELLTGRPLFKRQSEFETLKRARSAVIEPPSRDNPAVPEALDRIVLRALARHVDDRYQSALGLRDDLWQMMRDTGHFYARNELATWMRETFGRPPDPTEQRLVDLDSDAVVTATHSRAAAPALDDDTDADDGSGSDHDLRTMVDPELQDRLAGGGLAELGPVDGDHEVTDERRRPATSAPSPVRRLATQAQTVPRQAVIRRASGVTDPELADTVFPPVDGSDDETTGNLDREPPERLAPPPRPRRVSTPVRVPLSPPAPPPMPLPDGPFPIEMQLRNDLRPSALDLHRTTDALALEPVRPRRQGRATGAERPVLGAAAAPARGRARYLVAAAVVVLVLAAAASVTLAITGWGRADPSHEAAPAP